MPEVFFSPQGERSNGFFGASKPRKHPPSNLEQLQGREEDYTRLLEASGSVPEPAPAPLERVSDILLRPVYAGAGAAEELYTTGDIRAAMERAGREFFSGIGGLHGEKQTFGGVLKDIGAPELGHLSALTPFLYNETGKGWKAKAGGPWDPTGRGALGFALDTPLDPLTYVSFGSAPGGTSLIRVGGRVVEKQAFSRAGMEAVSKIYEHELPQATKLAGRILKGMREKVVKDLPEEIASLPPIARQAASKVRLEGEFTLAKRELENVTTRLQKKPLDPFLMAEHQTATARVADLNQRLNTRSIVEEVLSRDLRSGLNGVTDDEALRFAREQQLLAAEIAHQNSVSRVFDMIRNGSTKYADNSVVRFAGKPLLNREAFKPIGTGVSRMLRHVNELPYGAQIMANLRKIETGTRRGRRAITSGIDRMFNETLKAARDIPGALEARTLFRAESRNFRRANLESVAKLTRGLDKIQLKEPATFAGRQIKNAAEYVALHLDDPVRFPKEALPPEVIDRLPALRALTAEWFRNEARAGIIDPKTFREHYLTHIFDNTDEEINQLSSSWRAKKGAPFDKTFDRGPWGESRVFPSLTDAVDYAQKLKSEGVINFDLKPILNVGEVLAKRGDSHAIAMAAERYYTRVINNFGLSKAQVGEEVFHRTFPEIADLLKTRMAQQAEALYGEAATPWVDRGMSVLDQLMPNKKADAISVGELLAQAQRGEKVNLKGLSPALKALYWMGRVSSASSMEDLLKLSRQGKKSIEKLEPTILEDIRNLIGTSRRRYLAEFNSPYVRVSGGPYAGMYMPQGMAEEAANIGTTILNRREVGGLLKQWDLFQDIFKTNVTSAFPAFHIRNAMSNVATTFTDLGLSAFNPGRMARVAGIMAGAEGTIASPTGRRYTYQEVGHLFEKYGLGTPETALADISPQLKKKSLGQRVLTEHPPAKIGRKIGQGIEDHAKLVNFVTWLERGLDPATAAERVHQTLFDYDQLSRFEKDVMRRIFPFYTWTSKNLRGTVRQILQHPGRVKAQLALSDQDRGPEREMLPNYLRGDFKIKVQGDGKLTYVTGLDLPVTSAIETALGTSGRNALQQNLASVTPALKAIMELGFKRDLWTGRSLEERQHIGDFMGGVIEHLPQRIQQWLEFQKGNINGEDAYSINGLKAYLLFKSYFLSRMFSSSVKLESDNMKSWLVDFFTNVDLREFDLSKQQELRLRNRTKEMEAELTRRGVLVPGRPFLPKSSPYHEEPRPRKKQKRNPFFD